jgi:hypothetical protein
VIGMRCLAVPERDFYIIYSHKAEMAFPKGEKDEKKLLNKKNGKK